MTMESINRTPTLLVPATEIGGCRVERILGQGGMGAAYLVQDLKAGEFLVLKTVLPTNFDNSTALDGFYKEATELLRIPPHLNVVRVRLTWLHEYTPYLLMDYVSGGDLWNYSRGSRRASIPECWWVLLNVAVGMRFLSEEARIVHRDIKPQNMLIGEDGLIKISDFGLAKSLKTIRMSESFESSPNIEVDQTRGAGTLAFMSPEQVREDATIDQRSDIWAVGASLYWLTTGRFPFEAATREEISERILKQEPTPPSQSNPQVDKHLEAIILQCLRKEPAARYANFGELQNEVIMGAMAAQAPSPFLALSKPPSFVTREQVKSYLGFLGVLPREQQEVAETSEVAPDGSDWLSYFQRIENLFSLRNLEEAKRMVEAAYAHDPTHPITLAYRARMLGQRGLTKESARAYEDLFQYQDAKGRRVPAFAYGDAIRIYASVKDWESAKRVRHHIEERLGRETDPHYREHFEATVRPALSIIEQHFEAIAMDERLMKEFAPDTASEMASSLASAREMLSQPEWASKLGEVRAAQMCKEAIQLAQRGLRDAALSLFQQAVTIAPKYGYAWADLGACLMELGRNEESAQAFAKACELVPEDAITWRNLATVNIRLQKRGEALACLDRVVAINPQDAWAWYDKGFVLAMLSRFQEALPCFQEAQRLGHPKAAESLAKCRSILAERGNRPLRAVEEGEQDARGTKDKNEGGGWLKRLFGGGKKA